ncbi:MAG: PQQ-binding-like beta-propeller repeat protein, partial [Proteobacteria bacterium]|nr:PQQ-binding-like beta-propeller repeat protein [Pseudomonadota bacterium]
MNNQVPALLAGILILGSSLTTRFTSQAAEFSQIRPDAQTLSELPTTDWLTNGGDLFNRNFSALTEINTDNVNQLGPVWRTHLDGSGVGAKYSGEAQPIVHDGVMYIITGADDVFALSIESGEVLWRSSANLTDEISTVCCGWASRGVGFGEDKIFVGRLDGRLTALDKDSGEELWSIQAEAWEEGYTITSAPLYFQGMVITGFAGAEFAVRGRVKAFSADDGSLLWTFYTVPCPGAFGHDT